MADDKAATDGNEASAATAKSVDDATAAAETTRATAKWIAAAIAAIPALGAFGALVRAPGDAGFEPGPLLAGILLAAIAAIIAITSIARVLEAAPKSDQDLLKARFDVRKVPGHPFNSYGDLLDSLADVRSAVANEEVLVSDLQVEKAAADATSAGSDAALAKAELALADDPDDADLKAAVSRAKLKQNRDAAMALQAASSAAVRETGLKLLTSQLTARETLRARALQLAAAEEVGQRYQSAMTGIVIAVLLGALGVFFLAIAPRTKTDAAAVEPVKLVTVTLNEAGKAALTCPLNSLRALRVGGTDDAPLLITMPTAECPSQVVVFKAAEPAPLGSLTPVTPVPLPAATP